MTDPKSDPLDDMLDRAGINLDPTADIGTVADQLLSDYCGTDHDSAVKRNEVLTRLTRDQMRQVIDIVCLLDESNQDSYDATDAMAEILLAEIRKQGGESSALRELVKAEIRDRWEMREFLQGLNAALPAMTKAALLSTAEAAS